ncbi:hypothetical protein RRG08_062064 [Elysia crispata]|uniref:Uncharacterized protein n=1 Tax=Elysia crispata TaxID=231223 RepID=A0AAE1D2A0_9GAST|nr:hypothetical protein RRG08_062064 [Elysia crispata]
MKKSINLLSTLAPILTQDTIVNTDSLSMSMLSLRTCFSNGVICSVDRLTLLVFDDCPLKPQLNSALRLEGKQKSDADDSLGKSVDCSSKSFTIMTLSSINCQ